MIFVIKVTGNGDVIEDKESNECDGDVKLQVIDKPLLFLEDVLEFSEGGFHLLQ